MFYRITILILLSLLTGYTYAGHISGGEMRYTLVQVSGNNYTYEVELKLFRQCEGGRDINPSTIVSVFNRGTHARVVDISVPLSITRKIQLSNFDPCIQNPPIVCYEVGYFNLTVTLPGNIEGYILSSQVIFRVNDISNLQTGYGNIGATYTAEIPGTMQVLNAPNNNSASFTGTDLVLVCANNAMRYSFEANDLDGDQLRYRFCNAFKTGDALDPNNLNPPTSPPYISVPYGNGFLGTSPLGNKVNINANTGLISGIAPAAGVYIVTVCVDELRNGKVIATQRKDIQIKIASCELVTAAIPPEYFFCKSNTTIQLQNQVQNSLINSQDWEIKNTNGDIVFSANTNTALFTFTDTGIYTIKLVVNKGQSCSDSTISIARVYPGTFAKFVYKGVCDQQPTRFIDSSIVQYGTVNSWLWKFGDTGSANDTSHLQNPIHQYTSSGMKQATLYITTSKGCQDSISSQIVITNNPPLQFSFSDTLICKGDTLRLQANAPGQYQWGNSNTILQTNSPNPFVFPSTTTTYYAFLNDNGCLNNDSIKVRVKDSVQLQVMNDTTICQNDSIKLRIISDGLSFTWKPATLYSNPNLKEPFVKINATTNFTVTATIGGCNKSKSILVKTIPYPIVFAGADTTICFNTIAYLKGITNGSLYKWMPLQNLQQANSLSPNIRLSKTTTFILSATDTLGCPKPASDSITVLVLPAIAAFAGNDTTVVVNQPLQLLVTGGTIYYWTPATYLSAAGVENPVATFPFPKEKMVYNVFVSNTAGCTDSANLSIRIFNTLPTIFVPTGFTPNNDGTNDVIRPILAGIKSMEYFRVYNRWGQLIFATSTAQTGWNGMYKGKPQSTGSYVWMVKAVDHTGKPYFQKGVVTLLR